MVFVAELVGNVELWPVDGDGGVVVGEATFIFGVVKFVTFVGKFGGVRENEEAMSEAARDEELFFVSFGKDGTNVLAVGSRAFTKVDGNVINFAL